MTHHLVTLTDGPDALDDHDHCNVVETFAFDGEDFDVAYVECKADHDLQRLAAHDAVKHIDDSDEETDYFLQVAPEQFSAQSDGVATIDDVRSLHETPESDPEDDRQTDGENVTVCAMDSGVWPDHPVFDDTEVEQADVTGSGKGDAVGHGGAVLGQISRLAPEAALLSLRIFGDTGSTDGRTIMRAYQFAHENVGRIDVLNSSWGASKSVRSINRVHNSLVAKGVVCVSAAGNSGSSGGSPATASRDFGVGACDEHGTLAPFSSWNPDRDNPDVLAVGVDNRLVRSKGTALGSPLSQYWTQASGTSFASPSVAGMVA
jgi:subtilisin family serine protease